MPLLQQPADILPPEAHFSNETYQYLTRCGGAPSQVKHYNSKSIVTPSLTSVEWFAFDSPSCEIYSPVKQIPYYVVISNLTQHERTRQMRLLSRHQITVQLSCWPDGSTPCPGSHIHRKGPLHVPSHKDACLRLCGRHIRGPSYSFSSDRIALSKLEIRNTSLQSLTHLLPMIGMHMCVLDCYPLNATILSIK